MELLRSLLGRVKNEPAIVTSVVVAALVAVAGHFGVVLDKVSVTEVVSLLVAGVVTRRFVKPASKA